MSNRDYKVTTTCKGNTRQHEINASTSEDAARKAAEVLAVKDPIDCVVCPAGYVKSFRVQSVTALRVTSTDPVEEKPNGEEVDHPEARAHDGAGA